MQALEMIELFEKYSLPENRVVPETSIVERVKERIEKSSYVFPELHGFNLLISLLPKNKYKSLFSSGLNIENSELSTDWSINLNINPNDVLDKITPEIIFELIQCRINLHTLHASQVPPPHGDESDLCLNFSGNYAYCNIYYYCFYIYVRI